MQSRNLSLLGMFTLFLIAYLFYALGMINDSPFSGAIALMGLVPVVLHVVIWVFFSYVPEAHRPYYAWGECLFIFGYLIVGVFLFSLTLGGAEKFVFLLLPQVLSFSFFYMLGVAKFDACEEASKIKKGIRESSSVVYILGNGLVANYSYSKRMKQGWLERVYSMGRSFFIFFVVLVSMVGGAAGLIVSGIISELGVGGGHFSAHGLSIYMLSYFCIALIAFGMPMIWFNFKWWKDFDSRIRRSCGGVVYIWPLESQRPR
ncbi:hypothetical protein [Billgrantia aerodenitrificans]|uniref:Uncharacterized protein n=1 Tax=Billgrantia aerodenitrificans TaxID=2733483 RepID=A0ABS9AUA8_9GAMM|nr:hypothetical protein [Halomonas aerodenitrificans]MCE8025320.1 hypothetical protein [Halomonas aerodenitrificans]